MIKTLWLPPDIEKDIRMHCEDSYPHEACGLLIGHHDGLGEYLVRAAHASANLSPTPEKAFEIDPSLIIHHQKLCRDQKSSPNGDMIIGHYHSHPEGQAEPSVHDQAQNYDKGLIWLIVQVKDATALTLKAFATKDGATEDSAQTLDAITLRPQETVPQETGEPAKII